MDNQDYNEHGINMKGLMEELNADRLEFEKSKIEEQLEAKHNAITPMPWRKKSKATQKSGTEITSVKRQNMINQETGEIIEVVNFVKTGKDINFDRLWLGQILDTIESIGNGKIKLLLYFMSVKNSDNLVVKTQSEMAVECGLSKQTITDTLKILIHHNFIIKKHSGAYRINPDMLFKGSADKRQGILITYQEEKKTKKEIQIDTDPDVFLQLEEKK